MRFEQLMYLTLFIGVFDSILLWNRLVSDARAAAIDGAWSILFIQVFVLAMMVLLIWLVARRRKNWVRWLMLVLFVVGVPFSLPTLFRTLLMNPFVGTMGCLQWAFQIVALYLIFTGDAREWFENGPVGQTNPAN